MLTISSGPMASFEDEALERFAHLTWHALGDVARQQGQRDPQAIAAAWLEGAVRIAMRRGIEDGQEFAVLALLVADLGGDFDLRLRAMRTWPTCWIKTRSVARALPAELVPGRLVSSRA